MHDDDTIRIAPSTLLTIVSRASLQVEGVARMGVIPVDVGRIFSGHPVGSGVALEILEDKKIKAELYLVVRPDINMIEVGRAVQQSVIRAVNELVGMDVISINIHIEDVAYPLTELTTPA